MKLTYIVNFLTAHNWYLQEKANNFSKYQPPDNLNLPNDYCLILPNIDTQPGFNVYAEGILRVLSFIYENKYSKENLRNHFTYGDELIEIAEKRTKKDFNTIVQNQTDWDLEKLNVLTTSDIELTI